MENLRPDHVTTARYKSGLSQFGGIFATSHHGFLQLWQVQNLEYLVVHRALHLPSQQVPLDLHLLFSMLEQELKI
jgi:hypothetical protein